MRKALPLLGLIPTLALAQQYSIDRFTVAGGGGTSAGGQYSISGTIGQHDAGGPMTGGSYSLVGGFWSIVSAVQTEGLPNLTVARIGNSLIVSWPNTGSCTLQESNDVAGGNWGASAYSVSTANGTNSISITSTQGNMFFRLRSP